MSVITWVLALGLASLPTAEDIAKWVTELGDTRYSVREQAIKHLWEAGQAAETAVRKAASSPDPETSRRAQQLVEKYDWGIFANTSPEVVAQIGRYRGSNDDGKHQAIRALFALGKPAYPAIGRLTARAESAEERQVLGQALASALHDSLPRHIRDGDMHAAEELLDACLMGEAASIIDQYVAVVMLSSRMAPARQLWNERLQQGRPRALEVAFALARADGDFTAARSLAETSNRQNLVEQTLWDTDDWSALSQIDFSRNDNRGHTPAMNLSLKALLKRLAGDADGFAASLDQLRNFKSAVDAPSDKYVVANGLIVNERFDEAIPMLKSLDLWYDLHYLHFVRGNYAAALDSLPSDAATTTLDQKATMRAVAADAAARLGQAEVAIRVFDALFQDLNAPVNAEKMAYVLRSENLVGLKEQALAHAAHFLDVAVNPSKPIVIDPAAPVLAVFFPGTEAEASLWWRYLQSNDKNEPPLDRLKHIIKLMSPGNTEIITPERAASFLAFPPSESTVEQIKAMHALAIAYVYAGQADEARALLKRAVERADNFTNRMKLAEFERGQRRFAEAADVYRTLADKSPMRPIPLYLQARCLAEAGLTNEAKTVSDLAFRLSVGQHGERVQLIEQLTKYGLTVEARRERDFVLKAVGARDHYSIELMQQQALDAAARKDFARAARLYERCLVGYMRFVDLNEHRTIGLLRQCRLNRARAELANGNADAAMLHANAALAIQPVDVSVPIQLFAGLVMLGRTADADSLYKKVVDLHHQRLKEYPDCAFLHNNLAWCAACCRRDLNEAIEHANRAAQLQPSHAGHFDTLAEAYHQIGDREKAIQAIKQALSMEPANAYYKSQLQRIDAGDRAHPPAEPEQ